MPNNNQDDKINKEVEAYKISRNSVEHFDRLLGQFRQIIFTFNGVLISISFSLFVDKYNKSLILLHLPIRRVILMSNLVAITNILVWLLEKHYHKYLLVSAKVANKFEKIVFKDLEDLQLTTQLSNAKEFKVNVNFWKLHKIKIDKFLSFLSDNKISSYDFLYLLTIMFSIFVNIYCFFLWLFDKSQGNKDYNIFWFLPIFAIVISVVYIVIIKGLIEYSRNFEDSLKKE
jgi:hypothetical protein